MIGIKKGIAVLALLLLGSGCASDRIADLKDCGRLSIGVGLGLSADVKIGDLTHPSLGLMSYTYRVGHENRDISGQWSEMEGAFPLVIVANRLGAENPFFASYIADTTRKGGAGGMEKFHRVGFWLPFERRKLDKGKLGLSPFNTATDLQAGATLGIVSARAGINPLEIVDFLLGFVGLDIARDDEPRKKGKRDKS
ncbi:MAG: hypothetical protein ACLFWL_13670 [Candidatus Brocadiia bacterium]|nr:hypothetical protein [Planctomycetota bacterium]